MNLIYTNDQKYIAKIEQLYLDSFPENERIPFWLLKECFKENHSVLFAVLDSNHFIGMCYLVNCESAYYLMYLAVIPELRNQKYGSKILFDLKEKYKTLFLSIERPIDAISLRRQNFYLRNGFYNTNKYYYDNNVNYIVLCTNKKYKITNEIMQKRYSNMTNNYKLFKIIANIFNTNFVDLK